MKTAIALTVGIVMPFGFFVLAALLIKVVLARYRPVLAARRSRPPSRHGGETSRP